MKTKQTIILFKGIYDTLDLFSNQLAEAFAEWGYEIFTYNAGEAAKSKSALLEMLAGKKGNAVVVTFNNMGYNLEQDDVNVWEQFEVPYINILMDHPFHFERPLKDAPATAIVLCTDRNHVKYIRRYYKNIRRVDFLPHAGIELGRKHKPLKERKIDVLYAGALPIFTVAKMIPSLDDMYGIDLRELMQEVLRELVLHPDKTTEQAIEEYVQAVCAAGQELSDEELRNLIVHMRFIDSYATSFFREQAVRSLVENGIEVTAYGVGWNQCEWSDNPHLKYGGKVLAPQILPLMNDSKIALNTMTWFKAGAHDRIFNGMLAGAAVVTDDSTYLHHECTDGKELVMFKRSEIATLPDRVCELFGHIERAQEIADCGYHFARENHTWKNRAEYIVECFLA
ncbi:MAG: glycosyltransferase family 1 protein [Roseburia sp.]|nr:glycosyltransferase family 1 protein [Roseburia sp.]